MAYTCTHESVLRTARVVGWELFSSMYTFVLFAFTLVVRAFADDVAECSDSVVRITGVLVVASISLYLVKVRVLVAVYGEFHGGLWAQSPRVVRAYKVALGWNTFCGATFIFLPLLMRTNGCFVAVDNRTGLLVPLYCVWVVRYLFDARHLVWDDTTTPSTEAEYAPVPATAAVEPV